jgi:hypothetical protein
MKKIRNINVQGNVFSYAGPVGGGRSSRKSPESYSSASPPVSLNSVINLLKKGLILSFIVLFTGLTTLGLTGCAQPEDAGTETETENPQNTGNPQSTKSGPLSKVITVNDVDTLQMLTGYDQSLADGFFRNLQSGLKEQTAFMMNSTGKLADNIRGMETAMNKSFRMTNEGKSMLYEIDGRYLSLINELCILSKDSTAYRAKVTAYLDAVQINHRNPSIMLNKNSTAATLIQEMQRNGVLPNGAFTIESAIIALETVLVRDMPAEAGQTGYNLLQQLTDFSEIHGLADDVTALGFSLSPTGRSVSAPTRESIAAAEGIVK